MLFKTLFSATALLGASVLGCSDDRQCDFGNYFILRQKDDYGVISWEDAEQDCVDNVSSENGESHLATILTEAEFANARMLCAESASGNEKCWIGLKGTDEIQNTNSLTYEERYSEWADGTTFDAEDGLYRDWWCYKEPSIPGKEQCVLLNPETGCKGGDWDAYTREGSEGSELYYFNDYKCDNSGTIQVTAWLCNNPDYDEDKACICDCEECLLAGDPHVHTFDKWIHHYQGTCVYRDVYSCDQIADNDSPNCAADDENAGMPFSVNSKHTECYKSDYSCVELIIISFYDEDCKVEMEIVMGEDARLEFTIDVDDIDDGNRVWNSDQARSYRGDVEFYEQYIWSQGRFICKKQSVGTTISCAIYVNEYVWDDDYSDPETDELDQLTALVDCRVNIPIDFGEGTDAFPDVGYESYAEIYLAHCWYGRSCGLCGYYDGEYGNDMRYNDAAGTSNVDGVDGFDYSIYEKIATTDWSIMNVWGDGWRCNRSDSALNPPTCAPATTDCGDDCQACLASYTCSYECCEADTLTEDQTDYINEVCVSDACAAMTDGTDCDFYDGTTESITSATDAEWEECADEYYKEIYEAMCVSFCPGGVVDAVPTEEPTPPPAGATDDSMADSDDDTQIAKKIVLRPWQMIDSSSSSSSSSSS
jgi:hypothetical protein